MARVVKSLGCIHLLPLCLEADEEEDLDQEDLVRQAVTIIEDQLEGKNFK
ncbi:hypothetical protein KJK41_20280 [Bacillus haikouensis]|nr:hypothetical protein KJK41_20280 [Bacillus haikouensis]